MVYLFAMIVHSIIKILAKVSPYSDL